jgi:hypothetical protein
MLRLKVPNVSIASVTLFARGRVDLAFERSERRRNNAAVRSQNEDDSDASDLPRFKDLRITCGDPASV